MSKIDFPTQALHDLADQTIKRIQKHGDRPWTSHHQIYGVLAEEMAEVLDEVRSNDLKRMRAELLDVAVAAIWGVHSIDKNLGRENT